jgi:hypothetical protein
VTGVASRLPTRRRALAWGIGVLTLVLFVVVVGTARAILGR